MGRHKHNKGKKSGWKNKTKWEDEACCSAVDKLSLDEGNLLGKRKIYLYKRNNKTKHVPQHTEWYPGSRGLK